MAELRIELGEVASHSRVWLNGDEITTQLVGIEIGAHVSGRTWATLDFSPVTVVGHVHAPIAGFDGIERLRRRLSDG